MPRQYVRKRPPPAYTEEAMVRALLDLNDGASFRHVSRQYGIPLGTLHRRYHGLKTSTSGGRMPRLTEAVEVDIATHLSILGEYGMAFDRNDIKSFVKFHLDSNGIEIENFKNNLPGREWLTLFLERNKNILSQRVCQNINRRRASISSDVVEEFLYNLSEVMEGVPPDCIVNYDETNVVDSPQGRVQFFEGARRIRTES